MTAANHALTGAALATLIRQPLLAVPLAFLSHFFCDAVPHFGGESFTFGSRKMTWWLIIDISLAALTGFSLLRMGVWNPWLLGVCGFVAMSPDLIWLYHGLRHTTGKLHLYDPLTRLHHNIQWFQKPIGIVFEIMWAGMMLLVIIKAQ